MQVPRLDKIVLNMGVGEAISRFQEGDSRAADDLGDDRRAEAGDHHARKSIADLQAARGHAASAPR